MSLLVEKTSSGREFKVKDMSQAESGRLEIERAEVEMPGLMACRAKYGPSQPFKGARITGSLPMTIRTAVLIETLTALGAEVRWCSGNIFSTQDHAAAASVARDSASVFAWEGQTLQEYWWCIERALDWGPGGGPDLVVDDGGDITLLIHEGVKAEEVYEKTRQLPDPASTDNAEFQIVLTIIRDGLMSDPKKHTGMSERLVGVFEETTTGIKKLNEMQANGSLLFPAVHVNGSLSLSSNSKFDNLYGSSSCSFRNKVIALLELWKGTEKYEKKVYVLPDEKLAAAALDHSTMSVVTSSEAAEKVEAKFASLVARRNKLKRNFIKEKKKLFKLKAVEAILTLKLMGYF
ncbi:Adenosylhomocysteinase [Corchorus capsularis]|uniref:Adenosylhomocysteinase n=1 Tax=Corchorus capsularis TaxID=210143 RepID=A0A1R3GIZ0_COCAP|nr:Adenosylhomocysteinase [Corchorus capsularis]